MATGKQQTVADFLAALPDDKRAVVTDIRERVNAAIPDGYDEAVASNMILWQVPLELSGPTYNKQPMMYLGLAAQKRHYALYMISPYAEQERHQRIEQAFRDAGYKFDMGKSCLRFTDPDKLAWDAIAAEIASLTPRQFLALAEEARRSGSC